MLGERFSATFQKQFTNDANQIQNDYLLILATQLDKRLRTSKRFDSVKQITKF